MLKYFIYLYVFASALESAKKFRDCLRIMQMNMEVVDADKKFKVCNENLLAKS